MKGSMKTYPNVEIGEGVRIGEFVIIGEPPAGKEPGELETIIGDNAIIRSHTVIYAGNKIGINFQTGHGVLIRECNSIGDNVNIGSHSVIEHHVSIGDNVRIHSNAFIPEFTTLAKNCWIGPCTVLTNARYPKSLDAKKNLIGPSVGENAIIGANVTILPGIIIGEGALIGAGSLVSKDVSPNTVGVGNPLRIINKIANIQAYNER